MEVCIFNDCEYWKTDGCRVRGLEVYGIQECCKYKPHVNFDQDYEDFLEHIKAGGKTGAVTFTKKEDSGIRFFVQYLNCKYRHRTRQ